MIPGKKGWFILHTGVSVGTLFIRDSSRQASSNLLLNIILLNLFFAWTCSDLAFYISRKALRHMPPLSLSPGSTDFSTFLSPNVLEEVDSFLLRITR